jgi:hypothetical protein
MAQNKIATPTNTNGLIDNMFFLTMDISFQPVPIGQIGIPTVSLGEISDFRLFLPFSGLLSNL